MALIRKTDGSTPANIIKAAWWNDFMDLFTGAMSDQAVNVNNTINGNSIITGFGHTQGYQIENAVGTPTTVMTMDDGDTDTHLLPTPTNHKLRITKDTYAYDIAVFDMSGSTGATTINGSLTVTGTFSPAALSVNGALHMSNNQYVDFKDTTGGNTNARLWCDASNRMVYKACTGNNHLFQNNLGTLIATIDANGLTTENNINIHAGQLNFTAGGNGAIRNVAVGGELDISAGGSAGVKFYTGNMSTVLALLDTTGLNVSSGGVTAGGDVNITLGNLNVGSVSNLHQINFASGNNGSIRNPAGGALELTAGGSAAINFFTAGFGTSTGSIDNGGNLTINGTLATPTGDIKVGSTGHATALIFNAGNNGSINNPSGGVLGVCAGGSAKVQLYTAGGSTAIGYADLNGFHLDRGAYNMLTGSISRLSNPQNTSGAAGTFNHNCGASPSDCAIHPIGNYTPAGSIVGVSVYNVTSTQLSVYLSVTGTWWQSTCWV